MHILIHVYVGLIMQLPRLDAPKGYACRLLREERVSVHKRAKEFKDAIETIQLMYKIKV